MRQEIFVCLNSKSFKFVNMFAVLAILLIQTTFIHGVVWNRNGTAESCDFPGNDVINVQTNSSDCYNQCVKTKNCTHYTILGLTRMVDCVG